MQRVSVSTVPSASVGKTARFTLLVGIGLVVVLTAYGIIRFPLIVNLAPVESLIYLIIFALLLIGYGWYGLRQTNSRAQSTTYILGQGLFFGLVIGLLWVIEVVTGNLNFANADWANVLYFGSMLVVLIVTFAAGFRGAQQSARTIAGIQVGLWSGMISSLITFIALMLITYLFQAKLQAIPQNMQEYLRSGAPDFTTYLVSDSLAGATNHLWIGPFLGLVIGGIGSVIGKALANSASKL